MYQAALNQQQKIRNYHTHSRTESNKQTDDLKPSSLIYAVFTTPQNAIPGSAVCAFQIDDIIETFEGKFDSKSLDSKNAYFKNSSGYLNVSFSLFIGI